MQKIHFKPFVRQLIQEFLRLMLKYTYKLKNLLKLNLIIYNFIIQKLTRQLVKNLKMSNLGYTNMVQKKKLKGKS